MAILFALGVLAKAEPPWFPDHAFACGPVTSSGPRSRLQISLCGGVNLSVRWQLAHEMVAVLAHWLTPAISGIRPLSTRRAYGLARLD